MQSAEHPTVVTACARPLPRFHHRRVVARLRFCGERVALSPGEGARLLFDVDDETSTAGARATMQSTNARTGGATNSRSG